MPSAQQLQASQQSRFPASPASPAFACSLNAGGTRAAWVHVAGELDLATSPQLEDVLREARLHARLVVLDAREVNFIHSAGVHVILTASRSCEREAGRLMVVPCPVVERMFSLSGASGEISTFDLSPAEPAPALHLV